MVTVKANEPSKTISSPTEGLVAIVGTPAGLQLPGVFQEPAAPPFQVFTVALHGRYKINKMIVVNILMITIENLSGILQDIEMACCRD
jgi:hypothetical protein